MALTPAGDGSALSTVVIAFETEDAARRRLISFGYSPLIAAEIAVYLAQATDLPHFAPEISGAMRAQGLAVEFVELDELPARLSTLAPQRESAIVWAMTDGVRYYRGSAVPALARLEGFARFGSAPTAAHIAQDKFASLALAAAAGLAIPPTRLMEDKAEIAALGDWPPDDTLLFVKPNALGAKIGIFADSLCKSLTEAAERSARIWRRYRDRALVQPFIEGDDVRVSFLDLGGPFRDQLGVERIVKDPSSETGGAFLTMKDNETLSGARDTAGARGGFGQSRDAAFIPRMIDLRAATDRCSRRALDEIEDAAERLARLAGLSGCFSLDFRVDAEGGPTFLEFEICPAVTIYDFQNYLAKRGLTLGAALARAMRLAFARAGAIGEA